MLSEPEIQQTSKAMVAELLRRLGPDVDIVFEYGSRVSGRTHRFSDLDFSFVPSRNGVQTSITVLVGGTLFDLYPMNWSKLEEMANFSNVSSSILLVNRVVYKRDDAVLERFHSLQAKLRHLLAPECRPDAVKRALSIFQQTGYPFLLLVEAAERGHVAASVQQAQEVLSRVLHSLAVLNQSCIDTRKIDQALSLELLPDGFEAAVAEITGSFEPAALRNSCQSLLVSTRGLLVGEQRKALRVLATFPEQCRAMYPEMRADLDKMRTACARGDLSMLKTSIVSVYVELQIRMAQVEEGVEYVGWNALMDFEANLESRGFPPLLALLERDGTTAFEQHVDAFDNRLRDFLVENQVGLNEFRNLRELKEAFARKTV